MYFHLFQVGCGSKLVKQFLKKFICRLHPQKLRAQIYSKLHLDQNLMPLFSRKANKYDNPPWSVKKM